MSDRTGPPKRTRGDDRWDLWKDRLWESGLRVVCIAVIIREGFFTDGQPNVGWIATMVGFIGLPTFLKAKS